MPPGTSVTSRVSREIAWGERPFHGHSGAAGVLTPVMTCTVLGSRCKTSWRASLVGRLRSIALTAAWTQCWDLTPGDALINLGRAAQSLLKCLGRGAACRSEKGRGCRTRAGLPDVPPEGMGWAGLLSKPTFPRGAHAWFSAAPTDAGYLLTWQVRPGCLLWVQDREQMGRKNPPSELEFLRETDKR